jgi:hypothetical protein
MRELTKSMLSFSLAMPLFGMKQMMSMAMPQDASRPWGHAEEGFDAVTAAAQRQLDGAWASAWKTGDQLQRQMVDLMFCAFSGDAWNPNRWLRMTSDVMQGGVSAARQAACGCGTPGCQGGHATAAGTAPPAGGFAGPPSGTSGGR